MTFVSFFSISIKDHLCRWQSIDNFHGDSRETFISESLPNVSSIAQNAQEKLNVYIMCGKKLYSTFTFPFVVCKSSHDFSRQSPTPSTCYSDKLGSCLLFWKFQSRFSWLSSSPKLLTSTTSGNFFVFFFVKSLRKYCLVLTLSR